MTTSQEAREYPPLPPLDDRDAVWKWALSTGVWHEPFTLDGLIVMLRRALDSDRNARQQEAMDAESVALWLADHDLLEEAERVRAAIAKGERHE